MTLLFLFAQLSLLRHPSNCISSLYPTFAPVADSDRDGVADSIDQCSGTPAGAIVDSNGCSIDQLVPCDGPWKNHGQYVSSVAHAANEFLAAGLITDEQKGAIVSAAAQSDCGKKKK